MLELEKKLQQLTDIANSVDKGDREKSFVDENATSIEESRRLGYQRILSGVATTEHLEDLILDPIIKQYTSHQAISEYLKCHKNDEDRHFFMLNRYLKETFTYVKNHKTLSDRIFYDRVFPVVNKIFEMRPIYALVLIRSFEKLSIGFYKSIVKSAKADKLNGMVDLLDHIMKDELRHIAGIESVIKWEAQRGLKLKKIELPVIKGMLKLLLLDVNMQPYAIHNRSMRERMLAIDVDLELFHQNSVNAVDDSMSFVKKHLIQ
jgi:hypothetical protein